MSQIIPTKLYHKSHMQGLWFKWRVFGASIAQTPTKLCTVPSQQTTQTKPERQVVIMVLQTVLQRARIWISLASRNKCITVTSAVTHICHDNSMPDQKKKVASVLTYVWMKLRQVPKRWSNSNSCSSRAVAVELGLGEHCSARRSPALKEFYAIWYTNVSWAPRMAKVLKISPTLLWLLLE